jgi:hypothetical protein
MKQDKSLEELLKMAQEYVEKAEENAEMNPKTDTIQIVVVEPLKKPYKAIIPNELDAMKDIVQGYIQVLPFGHTQTGGTLAMTLNEEGKMIGLPFNRRLVGRAHDFIVGTFFITAFNMEGDNITLTDAQCKKMIKRFTPVEIHF